MLQLRVLLLKIRVLLNELFGVCQIVVEILLILLLLSLLLLHRLLHLPLELFLVLHKLFILVGEHLDLLLPFLDSFGHPSLLLTQKGKLLGLVLFHFIEVLYSERVLQFSALKLGFVEWMSMWLLAVSG